MDTGRWITFGALMLVVVWLSSKIKTIPDNQRVALFKFQKFERFFGPGLIIQYEKGIHQWTRASVGDVGELIAPDAGRFPDKKDKYFDLPIEMSDSARVGNLIRITGFTQDRAICILNPEQRKTIQCERCGHQMAVS